MMLEAGMNGRAGELRQAFDRSFSLPPEADAGAANAESLLALRIGSHAYALRLTEVSGLFVDRKITWLPSPAAELLGIAGLRATLLPVYDLGMLLGYARTAAPRWLLVTAGVPVGLAFERFDGHLTVPAEAIVPDVRNDAPRRHVREILRAEIARPIIHLPSVLETIRHAGGHDSHS
jgi:chemotaxis signal transduction protein